MDKPSLYVTQSLPTYTTKNRLIISVFFLRIIYTENHWSVIPDCVYISNSTCCISSTKSPGFHVYNPN